MDVTVPTIQPQLQAICPVKSWDDAWKTEYEDRALKNFLLYLDNLWQQRRSRWEYGKGTSHSFCAAIVQSSCAGKSRLVYSYVIHVPTHGAKSSLGSRLVAPVLNLLSLGPANFIGYAHFWIFLRPKSSHSPTMFN
jgi:hypothetical protein